MTLHFTKTGKRSPQVEITGERTLAVEELLEPPATGGGRQQLKRLRNSHHNAAAAFAQGYSFVEVAALTGYAVGTLCTLSTDPSFKELVQFYAAARNEAFVDVQTRVKSLAVDALEELQDRLAEKPEEFKTRELLDLATAALDRTGHGPTSKHMQLTATLSPETLAQIHKEVEGKQNVVLRTGVGAGGERWPEVAETSGRGAEGSPVREESAETPEEGT